MTRCAPFSIISACILLMCASIVQAVQGYPDALSVSFLVLGVTSVIHHCRLDEWWKRDVWRALDYLAIIVFAIIATMRFRHTWMWPLLCMTVLSIVFFIWRGSIRTSDIPAVHACIHVIVSLFMIWMVIGKSLYNW